MRSLRGLAMIALVIGIAAWAHFALFAPKATQTALSDKDSAVTPSPAAVLSVYKTDPNWIRWNEAKVRDPNFEWRMPLSFYGRVIDEHGEPVAGATASFTWTDMSARGTSTATSVSDNHGLFSLEGMQGKRLQVRLNKEGYYTHPRNPYSFEYAAFFEPNYHQPDRENPVVFRLRKKGAVSKELIVRELLIGIQPTGSPQFIDLRETRKASFGDFAISIKRGAPKNVHKYDWELSIEGINGTGLVESSEDFMFEAPEAGYVTRYDYRFDANSPDWQNQFRRNYFVRLADGSVYARLEIRAMPKYQDSAAARIRFFVNPTGSRNLEYRPNQALPSS